MVIAGRFLVGVVAMESSQAVAVHDLAQRMGASEVLRIAKLEVNRGEIVCIRGRNGSGKTALLRLLMGLSRRECSAGEVLVLGQDIRRIGLPDLARLRADSMGFVFQHFPLVPYLSAVDNILLPCYFSDRRKHEAEKRSETVANDAFRLIRKLSLQDPSRLAKEAGQYSSGQQQRFAIARALIGKPSLVLADEPASAMDSHGKRAVYQLLQEECRATGATLICTTHDDPAIDHGVNGLAGFDRYLDMGALNQAGELPW